VAVTAVGALTLSGLVLAGCGGAAKDTSATTLVATLGDSITAGSPGYDPDPLMRETLGFGADDKSQWQYWAAKANHSLRFRNCGVYGQRTDEIARRLAACAKGAQVLVVQGGINDIAQGRPVERAADNLRRMVERGRELVGRVALVELLPWNNGYPEADPKIRHLNALIHEIARAEHVPVLPFYSTLEDPERPGRMQEEWTTDGDHPSVEGYRLLGERAFRLP
jgi:lysophospholipase L1-like esterase